MIQKRVQVQIPPDVYDIVKRISELGGVSMGGLLGELIAENKQGLLMIADALEAAKKQDVSGAIDRLQDSLLDAMGKGVELSKEMQQARKSVK